MGRNLRMLLVLGVLLLTACSGGGAAAPARRMPEEVHAAWLEAMQQNDLPALLAMISPPFPDTLVMDRLSAFQQMLKGEGSYGKFLNRGAAFVRTDGVQQIGFSVWQVESANLCYRTEMAQFDGIWKVINFRRVEPRDCQST